MTSLTCHTVTLVICAAHQVLIANTSFRLYIAPYLDYLPMVSPWNRSLTANAVNAVAPLRHHRWRVNQQRLQHLVRPGGDVPRQPPARIHLVPRGSSWRLLAGGLEFLTRGCLALSVAADIDSFITVRPR